jgi:4-alpha-glucanotransferase
MHISSLPSAYGIGDFGTEAYKFADFLNDTKQTFWQVLPLNPISVISGSSPYASYSGFAGNTLFVSPDKLKEMGLLAANDLQSYPSLPSKYVDYIEVIKAKKILFAKAYLMYKREKGRFAEEYRRFRQFNKDWLHDFACFMAFKSHFNDVDWGNWPKPLKNRNKNALATLEKKLHDQINYQKFMQFIFFKQWNSLKDYCNERNIQIIGDIPYYVNYDSAEVWSNPGLFKLDKEKKPAFIAGVPPDYFSETGQLWGNPVYRWGVMKNQNFTWWTKRIEQNLRLYNIIRIDHFRGFLAYWEVPAQEKTAIHGRWVSAPGEAAFNIFRKKFGKLPILAEDLGVITDDVRELMKKFDLPGMRILVFAFDEKLAENAYAPHNHIENCVVYTGTHDNNTVRGWFKEETTVSQRERIFKYLGLQTTEHEIHRHFIRLAMGSVARIVLFPLQDILGLDSAHRMNRPATLEGNWKWRLLPDQLTPEIKKELLTTTELFGRARA